MSCIDAFFNNTLVGLVFVDQAEFFVDYPNQRIPPEDNLEGQEEEQIKIMPSLHMHQLMGEDCRVFLQVFPAYDNLSSPAKGRYILFQDYQAAVFPFSGFPFSDYLAHLQGRYQIDGKSDGRSDGKYCQEDLIPRERRLGCLRFRSHFHHSQFRGTADKSRYCPDLYKRQQKAEIA